MTMTFLIIIAIVILLFVIGLLQKNSEQKADRHHNQQQGGLRALFPILTNMLEKDLKMRLMADTGDNFFYQKELEFNGTSLAIFRIGRRIDYTRNILLYTELLTNRSTRISGLPIIISDDVSVEEYKKWIYKSCEKVLEQKTYLLNIPFFKYLLNSKMDDLEPIQKEETISHILFHSKENYFKFWHSLNQLDPSLDGMRITCTVIDKYSVKWKLSNEGSIDEYLLLDLIKDRKLKSTDTFFINFSIMPSLDEKIKWHEYQVKRLLEKVEKKELKNIKFDEISVGDRLSFDIKYNTPPLLEYSEELGGETYQLSWAELEKRDYWGGTYEYEFSNFSLSK